MEIPGKGSARTWDGTAGEIVHGEGSEGPLKGNARTGGGNGRGGVRSSGSGAFPDLVEGGPKGLWGAGFAAVTCVAGDA